MNVGSSPIIAALAERAGIVRCRRRRRGLPRGGSAPRPCCGPGARPCVSGRRIASANSCGSRRWRGARSYGFCRRRRKTPGSNIWRRSRPAFAHRPSAAVRPRARVTAAAPAGVRRTARRAGAGRRTRAWFRLVPNFVVQTGDPHDTGDGDAGSHTPAELHHAVPAARLPCSANSHAVSASSAGSSSQTG